jgi:AraC-like DNA-binding protein
MAALVRAAALTGYAEVARASGLDPVRMADASTIPRTALDNPDLKISAAAVGKLLEASAARSGLEDFGLRLARKRRLSNLGAVGLMLREQPTLRRALEALIQYGWLQTESLAWRIEETGDVVVVYPLIGRGENQRQSVELIVAVFVRALRSLLGESWRPQLVSFVHAPPKSRETHRRVFECDLAFNQDFVGIVCARRDLDLSIPDADPVMAREIARYVELLARSPHKNLRDKVRELVNATLPAGQCTAERVSQRLGFDRRTLHRKLAQEGTTFSQIVEQVRARLDATYRKDGTRRLSTIAELLGFASLSAFSRWHRKRSGRGASEANHGKLICEP